MLVELTSLVFLLRWVELNFFAILTLKKICTTRWTSRIDAVRAVRDRYVGILKILSPISLTSEKKNEEMQPPA